jgi:glycosyltransferase involved in cell wall biosynthesis
LNTLKKVAFFTSAHQPLDDRIFYHMAQSLAVNFDVYIVSTCATLQTQLNGITLISSQEFETNRRNKINYFYEQAVRLNPDIIICSEPLPILAAANYKTTRNRACKIHYDITEYYPSNKHLVGKSFIRKITTVVGMTLLNLYAASRVTGFIFGEHYKSKLYRRLFPNKKFVFISYYPDLIYTEKNCIDLQPPICLGFTGKLSSEKGLFNFAKVACELQRTSPHITLKLIGWFPDKQEQASFFDMVKHIDTEFIPSVPFPDFSSYLKDIHFLFDLREASNENRHSLPIKLYLYAACGKPMFYADNHAIKREHPALSFVHLVDPENTSHIVQLINRYLSSELNYSAHAQDAYTFASKTYNWSRIKDDFLRFIETT